MADIELVIKLDEEYIKQIDRIRFLIGGIEDRSLQVNVINAIKNGTPLPKVPSRKFKEIVVNYPPAELCTYPEYRGKPYFSIKYEENGEHFIGFGTYNPEVFSRYLQEYFITPTIIEADTAYECGKHTNKWVPVSEGLPRKFEFVNCTCHSLIDDREDWVIETVYVPQPSNSPYSDWGNIPMLNNGKCEVVAWMYRVIPKPYKAESEDKE